jgi:hypothetical protein
MNNEQLYVPIFRDRPAERAVAQQLGGLRRFSDLTRDPLPMVEILSEDDFDNLELFRSLSSQVLVDVPYYLAERTNKHQDSVAELLSEYSNVAELFNNKDLSETPVLSYSDQRPINYGEYVTLYKQLSGDFDRTALRLFISNRGFTDDQLEALENLQSVVSADDILLFDLVDTGGLDEGGTTRSKINGLIQRFDTGTKIILNAFQPYQDENVNYGPRLAKATGANGFGDFVVNRRIERNVPIGDVNKHIRHYFPSEAEVNKFEGEDYDEAQAKLHNEPKWDGTHCDYCRQADNESGHHPFWKRVRMGHYLESVLAGEDI